MRILSERKVTINLGLVRKQLHLFRYSRFPRRLLNTTKSSLRKSQNLASEEIHEKTNNSPAQPKATSTIKTVHRQTWKRKRRTSPKEGRLRERVEISHKIRLRVRPDGPPSRNGLAEAAVRGGVATPTAPSPSGWAVDGTCPLACPLAAPKRVAGTFMVNTILFPIRVCCPTHRSTLDNLPW